MNPYTPKNRWEVFTDAELKVISDALYWMPNSFGERNLIYQQIAEELAKRRQGIFIGSMSNNSQY